MFNFSTKNYELQSAFANGETASGTLEDAIELATNYLATIELTDTAGVPKGVVRTDGSYTLA